MSARNLQLMEEEMRINEAEEMDIQNNKQYGNEERERSEDDEMQDPNEAEEVRIQK
jgi:hypothetical protein